MLRSVVLLALLAGCSTSTEEWRGFVYPNAGDLTRHAEIGAYPSLEACRAAALNNLGSLRTDGGGDYECGLNCDRQIGGDGPLVCEDTRR